MWSKIKFKRVRFVKARLIVSAIAFVLLIVMLVMIFSVLYDDKNQPKEITEADFDSLQADQIIWGKLHKLDGVYLDEQTNNYYVFTPNRKLLVFRAPFNSTINSLFKDLLEGRKQEVVYRGKVNNDPKEKSLALISLNMLAEGLIGTDGLPGNAHEYVAGLVDATFYENDGQVRILIGYAVSSLFMVVVIFFMLRRLLVNALYSYGVETGKIKPELKVTIDDLKIESRGVYENNENNGEFFYVNTEHEVKHVPNEQTQNGTINFYDSSVNESGNFYVTGEDKVMPQQPDEFHDDDEDRNFRY